jgi:hypothetical protein
MHALIIKKRRLIVVSICDIYILALIIKKRRLIVVSICDIYILIPCLLPRKCHSPNPRLAPYPSRCRIQTKAGNDNSQFS